MRLFYRFSKDSYYYIAPKTLKEWKIFVKGFPIAWKEYKRLHEEFRA